MRFAQTARPLGCWIGERRGAAGFPGYPPRCPLPRVVFPPLTHLPGSGDLAASRRELFDVRDLGNRLQQLLHPERFAQHAIHETTGLGTPARLVPPTRDEDDRELG